MVYTMPHRVWSATIHISSSTRVLTPVLLVYSSPPTHTTHLRENALVRLRRGGGRGGGGGGGGGGGRGGCGGLLRHRALPGLQTRGSQCG